MIFLAYYHVPVDPQHVKYLCFTWKGRLYQFKVLCFGVRNAPYIFDRLGKSVRIFLNLLGVRIVIYIDDLLVLASSFEQCIRDAQLVVDTLVKLGFHIKVKKCVFTPSQDVFFLGYLWNMRAMSVSLPEEKLTNIKDFCSRAVETSRVSVKLLQRLFGVILAARPAVAMTRARSRGIQRLILDNYEGTKKSAKKSIRLSNWAREDIRWWLELEVSDCHMSLKDIPVWDTIRLATDAMDTAIGSVIQGIVMYEELDPRTQRARIAHKEWLAFEKTVLASLPDLRNRVVTWHVDNMNVKQAWLNSGSAVDVWLCKRVCNLQQILHDQNTLVFPVYIRSAQHIHADFISRNKELPDWMLNRDIATRVFASLGHPEVDLMATLTSRQCPKYFSALVEEQAAGVDVFTKDWDKFSLAYVFPPPVMVELILNRIYQCNRTTTFIMITPWKPKSVWFPKALLLACQPPIRLPVSLDTVVEMGRSDVIPVTPTGGKIKFVAWKLSGGEGRKLENCPLGLNKLYSKAGRRIHRATMDWASDTTPSIAGHTTWMSLPRVQQI